MQEPSSQRGHNATNEGAASSAPTLAFYLDGLLSILYSVTLHLRLVNDKIYIEQDWTDDFLADLLDAGVCRDDVVLAFTPPALRAQTEYAIAL